MVSWERGIPIHRKPGVQLNPPGQSHGDSGITDTTDPNDKLCSKLISGPPPTHTHIFTSEPKPFSQKSKLLFSFPGDMISRVQFARNLRGKKPSEGIPNLSAGNIPPK